jgi:two-component sensor histidine kinase/FixJ family two-component response regulator
MSALDVLVVDDSPDDRDAIRRTISKIAGRDVTLYDAGSLAEAEQALVSRRFGCVLLDYRLPDSLGVEAVARLTKLSPETPVIMITGQGDERIAAEALRSGATDYLGKSLLANEEAVGRILDIVRARARAAADAPRTLRVLVVDDSEDDREFFERTLNAIESFRYEVEAVSNAADALKVIAERPPDCLVLDYSLPGLNGVELLGRFRQTNPYLPVVIVTGQGSEAIAVEAIRAGAQDYLPKSAITREDLHRCVRASVEKCRQVEKVESVRAGLEQLAAELKQSNEEIERFTSAASDDLREPLKALRLLPDFVARDLAAAFGQVPESIAESLELIRSQGSRMGELLERVVEHAAAKDGLEERVAARISDLEALNTDLEAALTQRDVLLAEVYHRVKNNLQFIDAVLAIETKKVADPALDEAFERVRRRIKSLGFVHEQILGSPDLETLDLGTFLKDICDNLAEGMGARERGVEVAAQIASMPIDLDRAIAFALVVNELLSNALKHAFPDGRRGRVEVRVTREGTGGATLVVQDDGVGAGAVSEKDSWSGGKILQAVVGQLKAKMDVRSENGTIVTVRVPTLQPAHGSARRAGALG